MTEETSPSVSPYTDVWFSVTVTGRVHCRKRGISQQISKQDRNKNFYSKRTFLTVQIGHFSVRTP